jgi:hypothetical protein
VKKNWPRSRYLACVVKPVSWNVVVIDCGALLGLNGACLNNVRLYPKLTYGQPNLRCQGVSGLTNIGVCFSRYAIKLYVNKTRMNEWKAEKRRSFDEKAMEDEQWFSTWNEHLTFSLETFAALVPLTLWHAMQYLDVTWPVSITALHNAVLARVEQLERQ